MNWKDFLTDQELLELAEIDAAKVAGQQQRQRIYDRCRKRMLKADAAEVVNFAVNQPPF
jgi:hypothetical protein